MVGRIDGQVEGRTDRQTDRKTNGQKYRQMVGQTGGLTDKLMDRCTNGQTGQPTGFFFSLLVFFCLPFSSNECRARCRICQQLRPFIF